jgi:hypothetical protein
MAFTEENIKRPVATKADWTKFVRTKAANAAQGGPRAPSGTPINGPDLQKVGKIAEKLSVAHRQKVMGMFQAFSKYEVLQMLLADGNPIRTENEKAVFDIVEAAALNDYVLENQAREPR